MLNKMMQQMNRLSLITTIFFLFLLNSQHQVRANSSNVTDCDIVDTIFLLDSSGSIRHSFDQYKHYVKGLIEQMPISSEGAHVALIIYSGRLRQFTKWALDQQPQEKQKLLERAEALPHLNGVTATGVALDVVTARELPKRRQGPRSRTNLVVLTDGFSYDLVDSQSANLHAMLDVRTFVVCLDEIRMEQDLLTIAGGPDNLFEGPESQSKLLPKLLECPPQAAPNYGEEGTVAAADQPKGGGAPAGAVGANETGTEGGGGPIEVSPAAMGNETEEAFPPEGRGSYTASTVSSASENGPMEGGAQASEPETYSNATGGQQQQLDEGQRNLGEETTTTTTTEATTRAPPKLCPTDFMFVLDGSGSLRQRFEHQKEMAAQLVEALPEGPEVRIGLIKFSGRGKSRVKVPLSNHLSRPAIQQRIRELPFFGGTTFTNEALEKAVGELYGDRTLMTEGGGNSTALAKQQQKQQQQVVAVFTDGMSQEDPTAGAKALQDSGAIVFTIAVEDGHPINRRELELIAGDPSRVFTDKTFDQLKERLKEFAAKNC